MGNELKRYFLSAYAEALKSKKKAPNVAVLNNTNIDILHAIYEMNAKKALSGFQKTYRNNKSATVIKKALHLASHGGGEIRIDDKRKEIENFIPFLQSRSENIRLTLGGNGGNAAVALSSLGAITFLGGTLRNTAYGKWIISYLAEHRVSTQYAKLKSGIREEATTFGIELIDGDRVFLNDGNDNRNFNLNNEMAKKCYAGNFSAVLLLGLHNLTTGFDKALYFVKHVDKTKTCIVTDAGDFSALAENKMKKAFEIFKHASIACFNEEELIQFVKLNKIPVKNKSLAELVAAAKALLKKTNNSPIVNIHTKAYSFDLFFDSVDKKYKLALLPGMTVRQIKTKTGLGDGYVAGKTIGFLQGKSKTIAKKMLYGLALGNASGACRAAHGKYCTLATLKKTDMTINEDGVKAIEAFLHALKYDKDGFFKRGFVTL